MKDLVQRLASTAVALGLAGCVSGIGANQSRQESKGMYWDRAYFQAITDDVMADKIYLFHLQFERYAKGGKGDSVVRALTTAEIQKLGIKTRSDLAAYLEGKCKESSGYIGPNLLF